MTDTLDTIPTEGYLPMRNLTGYRKRSWTLCVRINCSHSKEIRCRNDPCVRSISMHIPHSSKNRMMNHLLGNAKQQQLSNQRKVKWLVIWATILVLWAISHLNFFLYIININGIRTWLLDWGAHLWYSWSYSHLSIERYLEEWWIAIRDLSRLSASFPEHIFTDLFREVVLRIATELCFAYQFINMARANIQIINSASIRLPFKTAIPFMIAAPIMPSMPTSMTTPPINPNIYYI